MNFFKSPQAAIFVISLIFMTFIRCSSIHDNSPGYEIAAYYFPDYHPGDKRNHIRHGPGWSEWELVKKARPRFPGHDQPKVPLWGYTDESDPVVIAKKIETAARYGIDAFIFDWYYYDDGPFLEKCLEQGYMKAGNHSLVHWLCRP